MDYTKEKNLLSYVDWYDDFNKSDDELYKEFEEMWGTELVPDKQDAVFFFRIFQQNLIWTNKWKFDSEVQEFFRLKSVWDKEWVKKLIDSLRIKTNSPRKEEKKQDIKEEKQEETKKEEVKKGEDWNSWSIEDYKIFSDVNYKNFSEIDVNFYNFVWYKITEFTNFFYIFAFFVMFVLSYNLIKSILWK